MVAHPAISERTGTARVCVCVCGDGRNAPQEAAPHGQMWNSSVSSG